MSDPAPRLNEALDDRYTIERELGEGGMATVYLADDLKHERKVALKVLKPELAAVVGAERFLAEIKTTAGLQHPHILPLHDSGQADGFLFYVMPYVEGESLRDRLDREHQLPVDESLQIAKNVAEALDYAHRKGVIHRDIKPANILLLDGKPVISDFGIALAVGAAGGGRLTETGLSLGTPHYMSPEQATGDAHVGPATDVYALGCVLYEMLVGEPPFTGSTPQAVLGRIITSDADRVTQHRRAVPANVEAVISKALEKVPADRFAGAADFARGLGDAGFRHGRADELQSRQRRWDAAHVGLAVLSLALGAVILTTQSGRGSEPGRNDVFDLGVDATGQLLLDVSADGARVVYADVSNQLMLRDLRQLEPTAIQGTEGGGWPSFSPEGERIAFVSAQTRELRVVPIGGGVARAVASDAICCVEWASDGNIYYVVGDGVARVAPDGGTPPVVVVRSVTVTDFHLLPGGAAAVLSTVEPGFLQVEAVRLDTGDRTILAEGSRPMYTSSGHLVFGSRDGQLLAGPFDPRKLELGPTVSVMDRIGSTSGGRAVYSMSESGALVYLDATSRTGGREFVWVSRDGRRVEPVFSDGESYRLGTQDPTWRLSPDGKSIAFTQTVGGNQDVYLKRLPNGFAFRLTSDEALESRPEWGPDGQSLIFRRHQGSLDSSGFRVGYIWRKPADSSREAELLFDGFNAGHALWSPDGEWLVLRRSGPEQDRDVFALRLGVDSIPESLVVSERFTSYGPAVSPDGRWLAYAWNRTGQNEIWVRPFPDGEGLWQVSRAGGLQPLWSSDGRELFFFEPESRELKAAAVAADSEGAFHWTGVSTVFQVPDELLNLGSGLPTGNVWIYDVDPSGERFLIARSTAEARVVMETDFLEVLERLVPK